MPTENLVKAGRDVTLLIHESSMSPEEEQLARAFDVSVLDDVQLPDGIDL